jgi:hypothetical protein
VLTEWVKRRQRLDEAYKAKTPGAGSATMIGKS